jgi:hypothetical protein
MKKLFLMLLLAATLEARPIAFTNVNVLTMTSDQLLRKQTVLVDGGRITAVGADVQIPADAQQIDGENGYLMPGLIDLHVHLTQPSDVVLYVANGVTTVFHLSGGSDVLALRKESGIQPRIFSTGEPIVGLKNGDEARSIVAKAAADGYDGIKIYDDVAPEALPLLVSEAHRRGLLAVGHIPRNLTWQQMLAAKPDAVAHAEEFLYSPVNDGDDERIVAGMREGGIALIGTLVTYDLIGRQVADLETQLARGELRYVSPVLRRAWERPRNHYIRDFKPAKVTNLRRLLAFQKSLVKQLAGGGVPVLLGTDAGGVPFVIPGFSALDELHELVSAGLTPYQAMRGATLDAARLLKQEKELGSIEVGKSADLILLRGNPLQDIDNIALRTGVMLRGRWLDNAALHAELDRVAAASQADEALVRALDTRGVEAAIAVAKSAKSRDSSLNELAYQLLYINRKRDDALKLFRANAALHPESVIARDSLKEVLAAGR